jgi:hypothetical protein
MLAQHRCGSEEERYTLLEQIVSLTEEAKRTKRECKVQSGTHQTTPYLAQAMTTFAYKARSSSWSQSESETDGDADSEVTMVSSELVPPERKPRGRQPKRQQQQEARHFKTTLLDKKVALAQAQAELAKYQCRLLALKAKAAQAGASLSEDEDEDEGYM